MAFDTELVKTLVLINGGGVIALLTLFPHVLNKAGYEPSLPRSCMAC
jgi:hypothetical protein